MLDKTFSDPHRLAAQLLQGQVAGDPQKATSSPSTCRTAGTTSTPIATWDRANWMHGSGPAEKHVEMTLNPRFKRRGMRWSRDGARNLLAIRLEVIAAR